MKLPLSVQVLIGASVGVLFGLVFGTHEIGGGISNAELGKLGMLVIRLLKALAPPLILLAIIDAFVRTQIRASQGLRLVGICLFNVSVACTLALFLVNTLRPGDAVRGHMQQILSQIPGGLPTPKQPPADASIDPLSNLSSYVPETLVEPFIKNNVISIVITGILFGAALRRVRDRYPEDEGTRLLTHLIGACFQVVIQVLEWVIRLVPIAVLGTTADAVGRSGIQVFTLLAPFLGVTLLGLAVHSTLYYPLMAYLVGKIHPLQFLRGSADAAITGVSCNSSLATVPVTLRCLQEKLGISETSARLSACVGTNLNNDGITLYEAMAALFLAQALGPPDLTIAQQLGIVLASIMAGVGVAGVPEAGLIVLPLVLGAAGLSEAVVAAAIPLILPVDWIIARCRSGVNVMSDIVVAVMLEGLSPESERADTPTEGFHMPVANPEP